MERKILGRLLGGEVYRDFCALGGWNDLRYSVETLGENSPLTALNPTLNDIDPDGRFRLKRVFVVSVVTVVNHYPLSGVCVTFPNS